ncbi:MAG TPA: 3-methyl-2-oxobutanoate hydroxymethyltransferase [Candidatus Acidoferrales bacterium]|nr:3-methyl-2-oxobutanoate hydroxymethyltransferase [Candidatus Acidoferrales bacterium]
MSILPTAGDGRVTVPEILSRKKFRSGEPPVTERKITSVTAYDCPTGRLADEAGVDIVLVGDSLAMAVLGYENTLPVTMEEMLHHTRAVRRGVKRALLVADMPFGSFQNGAAEAVRNATRFVKEAGAEAVKIEGGERRMELVARLVEAEIPVMGHIGLTPQSLHALGGFRVQGKTAETAEALVRDAQALAAAGAFSIVIEAVPREIAARITGRVPVPTIGIGAGPDCDGQVLVLSDLLGLTNGHTPKFARKYAELAETIRGAVEHYAEDVRTGAFPADAESYHLPAGTREADPVKKM